MTQQLQAWEGEFGNAYTERNAQDWRLRQPAFRQMLAGLRLPWVLEVGCNRGHNLVALRDLLGEDTEVVGIEPNRHARELARASSPQIGVLPGSVFGLPFKDGVFDLVFTAGVLIHVAPGDLAGALAEIYRVSRHYILAIEYFAGEETTIHYRGHEDLLWKRDFFGHYQASFPDLTLINRGYWGEADGFDRTHWWLLEKPRAPHAGEGG